MRSLVGGAAAAIAILLAAAWIPAAASPLDATDPLDPPLYYCPGSLDGGASGAVTDAEHTRIVGDLPLPPGVTRHRVTVDGVSTVVDEAGPATSSEAAVFVHGNPGSSRDWDALLAATGRFGRAIAFDVPGFGHADKPPAKFSYTVDGTADYMARLLAQLGVSRVHLVMHDFGGPWGLQWAARHPDSLASAVVIDSGIFVDYPGHPTADLWRAPVAGEASMATLTRPVFDAFFQSQNPRPLPQQFVDRMYDDFDRGTRCAVLSYYRDLDDPNGLGHAQAAVLSRRRRPALVLWGANDPFLPSYLAERQTEAFPGARVVIFNRSGHYPFVDYPDRTRDLVVPFLAKAMSHPATGQAGVRQPPRRRARRSRHRRARPALRRPGAHTVATAIARGEGSRKQPSSG